MGGDSSKQEDYFLLEHISKVSLKNKKSISYYWVDPNKESHQDIISSLRQYFKIDRFIDVKTLKQEMSFVNSMQIVKVIASSSLSALSFDYLQSEPKINQIILDCVESQLNQFQSKYPKIKGCASKLNTLIDLLNKLEQKDNLQISSNNLLFLIQQDTKQINKYRLNYHCLTIHVDRKLSKKDFIEIAKQLYPTSQKDIQEFEKQYNIELIGEEKKKMVSKWLFRDSFFWDIISNFPKFTNDPKKLAYLRLPIKDVYDLIKDCFKEKKVYKEMHLVIELNEQEKAKLQKNKDNFLLFTSFVKAYISEKEANLKLKQNANFFKFTIVPNRKEFSEALDFGYIFDESSTVSICNIYNIFQIGEINIKTRRGQLLYGGLTQSFNKRKACTDRSTMTRYELDLLRNYDYLEDMLQKIDSQATLLQLSGYYKQSLEVYDKKVNFLRKTNDSEDSMNRYLIKKADALRISGEFQNAQEAYEMITNSNEKIKLLALIHRAELYVHLANEIKLEKVLNEIEPKLKLLEESQKEQYIKASHLLALRFIKKSQYKKALKMLEELMMLLHKLYDDGMEGKPLVHDIHRSIATCKSKMGLHKDALQMLKTTLGWQLACEGKTSNVAMTENLIQTVCKSCGNESEYAQSAIRLISISSQIQPSEARLQSAAMIELNQSLIAINLN